MIQNMMMFIMLELYVKLKENPSRQCRDNQINCYWRKRVALRDFKIEDGSIFSTAEVLEDIYGDTNEEVALVRKTTAYFEQARRHMPHIPAESLTLLSNGTSASLLADTISQYLPIDLDRKQKFLKNKELMKDYSQQQVLLNLKNDQSIRRYNQQKSQRKY